MSSFTPHNSSANIEPHAYNNRLRSAGNLKQKSISDIVQVDIPPVTTTKTTDNQNVPITTMDQLIAKVAGLNITSVHPFDASTERVEDFLEDLDRHFRATNKEKDQDKLDTLVSLLAGKVRSWYRYQTEETKNNYTALRKAIQETYSVDTSTKHMARSALFNMTQSPHQDVKEFVHTVQEKARGLDMREKDLVAIILNGVHPNIRQFLTMNNPQTIKDITSSPAAQPTFANKHQNATVLALQEELRAFREAMVAQASVAAATAATAATPTNPTPQHRQVRFKERQDHRERSKSRERSASRERNSQNFSKCSACASSYCNNDANCWARQKHCHYCRRKGHIKPACRVLLQQRKNGKTTPTFYK